MEIPIELPLDSDGFLRRECPHCEKEFKWFNGRSSETPSDYVDPPVYWCPLCGRSSSHDSWFTQAQIEYSQAAAMGPAFELIQQELKDEFRRNKYFKFEGFSDRPDEPDPLVETDDMEIIQPPCHPWEPVKVPEEGQASYYCLACGQNYAV